MTVAAVLGSRNPRRDMVLQVCGGTWFLILAVLVAVQTCSRLGSASRIETLARFCPCVFYMLLWYLICARPPATARARGILPRVAAFAGTYLPWCITLVADYMPWPVAFAPDTRHGVLLDVASMACVLSGLVMTILTVSFLGKSFSIVPQARSIVQRGPYRWIRHPLYAAEELAVLGIVLRVLSPVTFAIFVLHIVIQVCRILYEEKLLLQTFPEYGDYSTRRWRAIPFVW